MPEPKQSLTLSLDFYYLKSVADCVPVDSDCLHPIDLYAPENTRQVCHDKLNVPELNLMYLILIEPHHVHQVVAIIDGLMQSIQHQYLALPYRKSRHQPDRTVCNVPSEDAHNETLVRHTKAVATDYATNHALGRHVNILQYLLVVRLTSHHFYHQKCTSPFQQYQ